MDNSASTIVQEILRDRESGAARLVAECKQPMYEAALALCGDHAMAEDLVFRTFERVLDRIATCRDESAFTAWMKSILRNEWLMSVRGAAVRNTTPAGLPSEVECMAEPDDGVEAVERSVDAALLRDAIDELPADMREAILLRYFMGLPLLKTAKILAVPVGTINSRLHYARKVLAAKLGIAAKKPGVKALLIALALAALTAVGAAGIAAIRSVAEPEPEEAEVVLNAKSTENTDGALTGFTGFPTEGTDPEPADPSLSSQAPATNHETNGDSPQQVEAITANSNINIGENAMNTQSVKSAAVKVLAAAALHFAAPSARAADYYNYAVKEYSVDAGQSWVKSFIPVGTTSYTCDGGGTSSISGTGNSSGWTDAKGGARTLAGITVADSTYHIYTDFACRSQQEADFTTPVSSSIVVEDGMSWLIFGKQGSGTTTLNNVRLGTGSTLHYRNSSDDSKSDVATLAGSIEMAGYARLLLSGFSFLDRGNSLSDSMALSATVTGTGAIWFSRYSTNTSQELDLSRSIAHKITGDIGGFTGDLCVFDHEGAASLSLELVNEQSLPGDPPAGATSYVVVTNGATLKIDQDWTSPANRVWDFGDGTRPTIEVAEGKAVEIKGALLGSSGFVKTGAGTLVLSGNASGLSGRCQVFDGKVVLKGCAASRKGVFSPKGAVVLPDGYTMLDSLSLTGGASKQLAYIDTGVTPESGWFGFFLDYRVDMEIISNPPTARLFGSGTQSGSQWLGLTLGVWTTDASTSSGHFGWGTSVNLPSAKMSGMVGNARMQLSLRNGVARLSRGWSHDFGTELPTGFADSIYVGHIHSDPQGANSTPVTIYRLEMFAGDTLIHDFVPVTRASDGAVGLYDARGDKGFRPAADAQYITAGPVYAGDDWLEVIAGFMVIVK